MCCRTRRRCKSSQPNCIMGVDVHAHSCLHLHWYHHNSASSVPDDQYLNQAPIHQFSGSSHCLPVTKAALLLCSSLALVLKCLQSILKCTDVCLLLGSEWLRFFVQIRHWSRPACKLLSIAPLCLSLSLSHTHTHTHKHTHTHTCCRGS